MIYKYDKTLVSTAQTLRKNMTKEEKHLWYDFLKKLPVNVNRQKNIGSYIVDFYISACRIVIEIDGRQHGEPENRAADRARDDTLYKLGITVLRYTNKQINQNFRGVCLDILRHMGYEESDIEW